MKTRNDLPGGRLDNSEPAKRQFLEHQNRFRGLVSEFRSKRFVEDRKVLPSRRFRSGLSKLLLDARAALQPFQHRPFLDWVAEQSDAQLSDLAQMPIHYEELSGIYSRAPVVSLERELVWITERIKTEAARINAFRLAVVAVERGVLAGMYEDAIEAIELLQQLFGVTLWSVQIRLALEHQAGGLERQKRYAADVRSVYKRGLLGFMTYHTSVRNEDRTTLAKFLDDVSARIENATLL